MNTLYFIRLKSSTRELNGLMLHETAQSPFTPHCNEVLLFVYFRLVILMEYLKEHGGH
jgi:hypothetical protein